MEVAREEKSISSDSLSGRLQKKRRMLNETI